MMILSLVSNLHNNLISEVGQCIARALIDSTKKKSLLKTNNADFFLQLFLCKEKCVKSHFNSLEKQGQSSALRRKSRVLK
jgi:hypothetical protein